MKRKLMMFLALFVMGIGLSMAQTQVQGTVVDDKGEPVIGATIMVKGVAGKGTTTDFNGKFTLSAPSDGTLVVSYVGMETLEVKVSPRLKIILTTDTEMLDEVLVVAYGTAKKSTFTGSAVVVDTKKIDKMQVADASKALEGLVPGLSVNSSSGRPGQGTVLRVRGIGSLNARSAPLIILDGAPYSGELNSINSKDIENISVLKDAASAALYGARGANGVIMITTKKGKTGRVQVSFDSRIGRNYRGVPEYDILTNPGEYYTLFWEAMKNSQLYPPEGEGEPNPGKWAADNLVDWLGVNIYKTADNKVVDENGVLTTAPIRFEDAANFNNWIDELYNPQTRQEYNLSITKGTEKNKIYFSLGYLDDKGFNRNTGFERISTRLSYDSEIYDWLKLSASSQFATTETKYTSDEEGNFSNTFMWTRMIAPIYPVYKHDENGKILKDENGKQVYEDDLKRAYAGGMNLIGQQDLNRQLTRNYYLTQNLRVDLDLPLGLKFNSTATFYGNWWKYTNFLNPLIGDGSAYGGILEKESNLRHSLNWNQILTWQKAFNGVSLEAMLGHETFSEGTEYMTGEKKGLLDPLLLEFRSAANISSLDSYKRIYKVEGFFGQLTADFANKYYLSGSLRYDGSSVFHPDHRWGTFWSLGASWRLKEEAFLKDVRAIDNLKLRVSYGAQGNDYLYLPASALRAYTPYTDLYEISSNGKESTYGPKYKGNKEITWEKNINFNVGLEFSILKGKLAGEFDFFSRRTNDMLFNLPVPKTTGFSTRPVNLGNMQNTGFEFNLTSNVYHTDNFSLSVGVNGTTYKNKVLNLPEEFREEGIAKGHRVIKEGGSIYDYYMVKYAGVNPENGDARYYMFDEEKKDFVVKGSKDYKGEKVHRQFIGSAIPKLSGGFYTNVSAYGVDLALQFAYRVGGYVYDGNYAGLMSAGHAGENWHKDILNRWTPNNKNTDVPRVQVNSQKLISTSDRFLFDGSYLALRNVTLGYNLPQSVLKNTKVQSLRVYVAADNVSLWSLRKGFDPRLALSGQQNYSVNSAVRTLSLGLNIAL